MKYLIVIFCLLAVIPHTPSFGCDCPFRPPLDSAVKQSDIVLVGKVIKKEKFIVAQTWPDHVLDPDSATIAKSTSQSVTYRYTISVTAVYKGSNQSKKFVVYSDDVGGMCGVDFVPGKSYFIYAYSDSLLYRNNKPIVRNYTTTCTRTMTYSMAEKKLLEGYFRKERQ